MRIQNIQTRAAGESSQTALKDLQRGDWIRGRILSLEGDSVRMMLSSGQKLQARIEGSVNMAAGEWMEFQVEENSPELLQLKPVTAETQKLMMMLSQLSNKVGVANTPENRVLMHFMLIQGIPLTNENINFILKKRYRISSSLQLLMERAKAKGMDGLAQSVRESLPSLQTFKGFLQEPGAAMGKLLEKLEMLHEGLAEGPMDSAADTLTMNILRGMLLQINPGRQLIYLQVPLRIGDQLLHSELWIEREEQALFLFMELPNLGDIGCELRDWERKMSVELFCETVQAAYLESHLSKLKESLEKIGCTLQALKVSAHSREGLVRFLSRYSVHDPGIDLWV